MYWVRWQSQKGGRRKGYQSGLLYQFGCLKLVPTLNEQQYVQPVFLLPPERSTYPSYPALPTHSCLNSISSCFWCHSKIVSCCGNCWGHFCYSTNHLVRHPMVKNSIWPDSICPQYFSCLGSTHQRPSQPLKIRL